jgi:hypothetical protein
MVEIPPIYRLLCTYEGTECHLPEHSTVELNWPCRKFHCFEPSWLGCLKVRSDVTVGVRTGMTTFLPSFKAIFCWLGGRWLGDYTEVSWRTAVSQANHSTFGFHSTCEGAQQEAPPCSADVRVCTWNRVWFGGFEILFWNWGFPGVWLAGCSASASWVDVEFWRAGFPGCWLWFVCVWACGFVESRFCFAL